MSKVRIQSGPPLGSMHTVQQTPRYLPLNCQAWGHRGYASYCINIMCPAALGAYSTMALETAWAHKCDCGTLWIQAMALAVPTNEFLRFAVIQFGRKL